MIKYFDDNDNFFLSKKKLAAEARHRIKHRNINILVIKLLSLSRSSLSLVWLAAYSDVTENSHTLNGSVSRDFRPPFLS